MKRVPPSTTPLRGDTPIVEPGFSYLPRFVSQSEATELAAFFGQLYPLWESRYADGDPRSRGENSRLTRPVYWLGAWQFAALGYYAEPDHTVDRCVRAEPIPPVMQRILARLQPVLRSHGDPGDPPNTCLVNYYGSERPDPDRPPIDRARLRMHQDAEPGAVAMLSIGQPAQFEFVDTEARAVVHSQWVRNRSVLVLSGPEYKDRLYHRVTRVRHGQDPVLHTPLPDFQLRRVSVSFRHVPDSAIVPLADLSDAARAIATPYVHTLSEHSPHFERQLDETAATA